MNSKPDISDEIRASLDEAKTSLDELSMFYDPAQCVKILRTITHANILAIELTKEHSSSVRNVLPSEAAVGLRAIRDAELNLREAFTLIKPAMPSQ
jgi:hypothetical protein